MKDKLTYVNYEWLSSENKLSDTCFKNVQSIKYLLWFVAKKYIKQWIDCKTQHWIYFNINIKITQICANYMIINSSYTEKTLNVA